MGAPDILDMEQLLSRFPRQTITGQLIVESVISETEVTVAYVTPVGIIPNFAQAGAAQFAGALVEWVSGPLCGLNPPKSGYIPLVAPMQSGVLHVNTTPNTNGIGRVVSQIASVASTGTPVQTVMTFVNALPVLPNAGDAMVVYQPPQPRVEISNASVTVSGQVDASIVAANVNLPVTGSVSVTAGTIDAHITEASINLPVTGSVSISAGTVDANITHATIDLPITGSIAISNAFIELPVTGSVTVTAGEINTTVVASTVNLPITGSVTVTAGVVEATIAHATIDVPVTGAVSVTAGTVDANITNATLGITGNVSVTAGVVDANITNAILPITGNVQVTAGVVEATITNSTVNLPVTGAVTIAEGTIVETNIVQATVNLPVTGNISITAGTVDANITNALIPITGDVTIAAGVVDATITKATIDVPITGNISITAGTVDANITNATLGVTGNVSITAGTVDANITNALIPVTGNVTITAGTVDANIQNASLDANIINEQVVVGNPLQGSVTLSIPSSTAAPTGFTGSIQLVKSPSLVNVGQVQFGVVSSADQTYTLNISPQVNTATTGVAFQVESAFLSAGNVTNGNMRTLAFNGSLVTCNEVVISVTQTTSSTSQTADTLGIYVTTDGDAAPDLTTVGFPMSAQVIWDTDVSGNTYVTPSSPLPVYASFIGTSGTAVQVSTTATLPVTQGTIGTTGKSSYQTTVAINTSSYEQIVPVPSAGIYRSGYLYLECTNSGTSTATISVWNGYGVNYGTVVEVGGGVEAYPQLIVASARPSITINTESTIPPDTAWYMTTNGTFTVTINAVLGTG